MKKNYFITLLLILYCGFVSFAQTIVFQESFETGNSGTPSETCNDTFNDFFTRTDGSDINSSYQVFGQDGNFFFAAQDTNGAPCTMDIETLLFDDINITTHNNLTLAILLAEDKDGANFDWDGDSRFYIEVDVDNSGTFTKVLQVKASANSGSNISDPMIDTDFDDVGDGAIITDTFAEFTASISSGSLIDIRLVFEKLTAGDEDIAIDNIRLINDYTLGVDKNDIEGFTTYPNPVTNKRFTISSNNSDKKQVAIFNVLGEKVFSSSFSGVKKNIDVSTINAGIYILKVTENGKIITKKLVIR